MRLGTVIAGRYRIEKLLGRGGMGAVYQAVDQQTHRARAVKLMLDHKVDDRDARERFAREAGIAGRIDSPFVVDVIDTGVDAETGTPYIVMELLEGENLDKRLGRLGPQPAAEVVGQLAQVARALQRMHARGVVHRDLKPSNLFREQRDGIPARVKVLDLGVAKVLSITGDTTAVVGSVPYMAPEQLQGRAVGPATDLYALGLIAFTLLTGSPYWVTNPDEPSIALAMKILDGTREAASARARTLGVDLPAAFDAWFARATARQPSRRFRTSGEAIQALAEALGVEAPWSEDLAEPEPPAPDSAPDAATSDGAPVPVTQEATRSASREALALAATVGFGPTAVDPPAPRWRARWWVGALAVGAIGLALWPRPRPSPLREPGSVLACPVLDVDGDVAQWGWLGAAAGSLACERARVLLGGKSSRTRVPAELLDLRDEQPFDADPYGHRDVRERSLVAARRGDAHLDGRVLRLGSGAFNEGFRVELVLRSPDTAEIGRGAGTGTALYEAVRAAMDGLASTDAVPRAQTLDPVVADYSRASDVATMLHLLDWTLAIANNAGGVEAECAWFEHGDVATDLASLVRYICAYMGGQPEPTITLPTAATPGARTARARAAFIALGGGDPVAAAELRRLYDAEASPWGKSVIAATLSCLLQDSARDEAQTWAWRAVREPKNPTGEWCAPWDQLMSVSDDTSREDAVTIGWRVWVPWQSYAWWFAARNTKDAARALEYAKRAYTLAPLDTNVAGELGSRLLQHRQGAGVPSIAARFAESPQPVRKMLSMLLTMRFDASEARFGKALTLASEAMRVRNGDTGWTLAQRLENAWRAVEIANVLGRASEIADLAVPLFVDPDPTVLDWRSLDTARFITAICAYASPPVAKRCFSRLDALQSPLTPAYAAGARLFAAGDLRDAARAWQPLVRDASEEVDLLADAMIQAFTATGALGYDLAIEIEARTRKNAALFDGANMAMARVAEAMHARGRPGDEVEAKRLASVVLVAWRHADTEVPILERMRQLAR
ncbi:MAG TPA: bifunctional serine/threonine protein kinase/MFS transporter [Kofleriaceae bacterium]|nr:bifunctional serine/threonine protein kinase/MFS transporter [Kofleriaceae bacterium]